MAPATEAEVNRLRAMETFFERIIEAVDSGRAPDEVGAISVQAVGEYRAAGAGRWARPIISTVDIVFDGPPGPLSGRFVEVDRLDGTSIGVGQWIDKPQGWSALRLRVVTL